MTIEFLVVLFATLPTVDELRALPHVAEVSTNAIESPSRRVIHILTWHWIPEDRFRLDDPKGDYVKFLDTVDTIQKEHVELILAMKVRTVFYEGLTTENRAAYLERVATLKKLKQPVGDDPTDELLRRFIREDLLQLGAPGRILMAGELDAVLPADDAKLLDAADPVKRDKIEFDPVAVEARERGTIKLLSAREESVLIYRGGHDFARLLDGMGYVRVAVKGYKRAAK